MVSGPITRWKVRAFSRGWMVVRTRATTTTTKKKAMVFSLGLMAAVTKVNGAMANRTALAFTTQMLTSLARASGVMASALLGSTIHNKKPMTETNQYLSKFLSVTNS